MAGGNEAALQIGQFLPMLVGLIFLFLLAAAALPDADDPNQLNLLEYYAEHRSYIWTLYALALASMLVVRLSGNAVGPDISRYDTLIQVVVLAAMVSLIFIANRWWHAAVLLGLTFAGPVRWLTRSLG
jgi:hypothetical protein